MAIRPEYEDLKFLLNQLNNMSRNKLTERPLQGGIHMPSILERAMNEINSFPILRQIASDLKNKGKNDLQIAGYINKHLNEISDARRSKWKDGDFIKVGRPKKSPDDKAKRKKAERYKKIVDIRDSGTISVKELKKITYNDIKNFNTQQPQRIAYFLQQRVKRDIRELHKAGYYNENAERNFENFGGYLNDIRTATLNQLRSFIRRGINFINKETSTVQGVNKVRVKTIKGLSEYGLDNKFVSEFSKLTRNEEKLLWENVEKGVELGYGTKVTNKKNKRVGSPPRINLVREVLIQGVYNETDFSKMLLRDIEDLEEDYD